MLLFKKEKKKDVLKGRTMRYLTKEKIVACSEVHLNNILNGKIPCSYLLAKNIIECADADAKLEEYFEDLEN